MISVKPVRIGSEHGAERPAGGTLQATQHLSLGATVPAVGQRDGVPVAQRNAGNVDRPAAAVLGNVTAGTVVDRAAGIPSGDLQTYRLPTEATERRLHTGFDP